MLHLIGDWFKDTHNAKQKGFGPDLANRKPFSLIYIEWVSIDMNPVLIC